MDNTTVTHNGSARTWALIFGVLSLLFGLAMGMAWCECSGLTQIFGKNYLLESMEMGYNFDMYDYLHGRSNFVSGFQFIFGGIAQLLFLIAAALFFRGASKIKNDNNYAPARKAYLVMGVALCIYIITAFGMDDANELPIFDQVFFTLDIPGIRGDEVYSCFFFELFLPMILLIVVVSNASKLKHAQNNLSATASVPVVTPAPNTVTPAPSAPVRRQNPEATSRPAGERAHRPETAAPAPVGGTDNYAVAGNSVVAEEPQTSVTEVNSAPATDSSNVPPVVVPVTKPVPEFLSDNNGKRLQIRKLSIDGGKYIGEVIKNAEGKTVPHGVGTWNNKKEYYEGCWCNGARHGTGTVWVAAGPMIRGEWKNGVMDGWFSYDYKDGYTVGPMVKGMKHGVWTDSSNRETYWNFDKQVPYYEDIETIVEDRPAVSEDAPIENGTPAVSSSDNVLAGLIPGMEFASTSSVEDTEEEPEEEFSMDSIRSDDSSNPSAVNLDSDEDTEFNPSVPQQAESTSAPGTGANSESSEEKTTAEPVSTEPSSEGEPEEEREEESVPENTAETVPVPSQEQPVQSTSAPSGFAFCPYCGYRLGGGFAFCPSCGNKVR